MNHIFQVTGNNEEANMDKKVITIKNKKEFTTKSSWVMIPSALCDIFGVSIMLLGLLRTSASSYQMLRGSVIIFTGISSRLFLGKRMPWKKWGSILIVLIGLIIVGLADLIQPSINTEFNDDGQQQANISIKPMIVNQTRNATSPSKDENKINIEVYGDILVVCSQFFLAVKAVYTEKVLSYYDIDPLKGVGWEGLYGFMIMTLIMIPLSYIDVQSRDWSSSPSPPWTLADPIDGFIQLNNNSLLLVVFCAYVAFIALYKYGAISVTKEFSATTKVILDTPITILVWVISLCVAWESFKYLKPIGYFIMVVGIFMYSGK